jgi:hypothetical protein
VNVGKNTYVEWPLGSNVHQARELVSLTKETGVKTVIGLQGRREPSVLTAKEIVESGRLGTIHSVNTHSIAGTWQKGVLSGKYDYMLDRKIGANLLTVCPGHELDTVFSAQGELKKGFSLMLGNFRLRRHKMASDGKISEETYAQDSPNQVGDFLVFCCERADNGRHPDPSSRAFRFLVCARLQLPPASRQQVLRHTWLDLACV